MNTATIHSELLERLPDIEDAFLETHRDVLLEAVGAVPGVDSVRAVVVRHLPRLVTDSLQLEGYLQAAAKALTTYPAAVTAGDPVSLMARHPAWVGLAHLEVAEALGGDADDAVAVAVQHATLGFAAASPTPVDAGEVLWAMAETAEEAGWRARADALIERAVDAPFADPTAQAQVRLLAGQAAAANDPSRASDLLEAVVDADVPHSLQVQAAYVRARVSEAGGDTASALQWLERAVSLVDPDDDPSVSARLAEEVARLRA